MKTKLLFLACVTLSIFAFTQTQNLQSSSQISTDFLRPGVIVTTVNFKGVEKLDLSKVIKPKKFDNFEIANNSASLTINSDGKKSVSDTYKKEVEAFVSSISGQVIEQALFIENNTINFKKLQNRSQNSMTETQRNVLNNLTGDLDTKSKDLLLDPVLENNYVIVISPTEIRKVTKDEKTSYTGKIVTSVYKVFVGDYENEQGEPIDIGAQKTQLLNRIKSEKTSSIKFPVKEVYSKVNTKLIAYGEDLQQFYQSALNLSILDVSKGLDEFKTKAKVEEKMLIALGTKEGLKVDDRYFSYEKQKDFKTGNITLKRKGIDRVKKVGNTNVDLVSNPNAKVERSLLYGEGGKKTRTGYISMEAPEVGVGISVFGRQNPGIRVDYRIGRYINIPNLLFYTEVEFVQIVDTNGFIDNYNGYLANAGVQKNFNLGRMFALAPFAQYSVYAKLYDEYGNEEEDIETAIIATGLRAIIKFGPSIQLMPEITYLLDSGSIDPYTPSFYEKNIYLGAALRYNF